MSNKTFVVIAIGGLVALWLLKNKWSSAGSPTAPSSTSQPAQAASTPQNGVPYYDLPSGTPETVATATGTYNGTLYNANMPGFTGSQVSPYGGTVPNPVNPNQLGYFINGSWSPFPY